jgi:hypothetical protein
VNAHHHVQIFPPIGAILVDLLGRCQNRLVVRRVKEPWRMIGQIPGGRLEHAMLTGLGISRVRWLRLGGFPGNDYLAGVTHPGLVTDSCFMTRWLSRIPGEVVELSSHPGLLDPTLADRDGEAENERLSRRIREVNLLSDSSFRDVCVDAGFLPVSPTEVIERRKARCVPRAA